MKSFAVCLISLLASVSAASAEAPIVSGHVRLVDGSAVAGAQVLLFDVSDLRRGVLGQATTDADGQFALSLGSSGLPTRFALGQNYPNPFNPGTVIPYQLETDGHVRLEVFNVLGQEVVTLVDGEQAAGAYTVSWDARDASGYGVAAGVYIYRLTAGGASATRRMVLVDGPAGSGRIGVAGPVLEVTEDAPVYGLTVSGAGVVTYVDAAFVAEAGPVEVVEEATTAARPHKGLMDGLLGDVNNDGFVNSVDALLVATYSTNPAMTVPNNGSIQHGDMDADGRITLSDALLILGDSVPGPARKMASETELLRVIKIKRGPWGREPTWSPDGNKIAYVYKTRGETEQHGYTFYNDQIWAVDLSIRSAEERRLSETKLVGQTNTNPAWSPDGKWIAYATHNYTWNIYVMSASGGPAQNLTNNAAADSSSAWSPDGTQIAFSRLQDPEDEHNPYRIFIMEVGDASDSDDGGVVVQEQTFSLGRGGEMAFVWIEPGVFQMGSPESEEGRQDREGPLHEVEISRGFWLGKYEVTQGEWESAMGETPWSGESYVQEHPSHPAVYISWDDVQALIERLNASAGEAVYRLPTEAEWEYACRAGTSTRWSFGDDESQLTHYAWYDANAWDVGEKYAHAVGTKLPNPWGLYDMHGNVWEWVNDWYGANYYNSSPSVDPPGPSLGSGRVVRGGDFDAHAQDLRSANRSSYSLDARADYIGVRLLRISTP